MEKKFYHCNVCNNLAFMILSSGINPECCGSEMTLLKANTSDGDGEKHLPVVEPVCDGKIKIKVGTQPHPMSKEHSIHIICLETSTEFIIRYLEDTQAPEVCICYTGKPKAVYEYCNIHGLWRTDISNLCSSDKCCTDKNSMEKCTTDKNPNDKKSSDRKSCSMM